MSLVVITGGIGAGKSTVMRYFEECGERCGDADEFVEDAAKTEAEYAEKLRKMNQEN